MTVFLILAVCFVAYCNGANDNFKGVASLFGSKTATYRTSIVWATSATFAGSLAAIILSQSLLDRFSGKGLVPDALAGSEYFLVAVAAAAGGTVLLATLAGFPISTTHALTGAILGSGWVAAGTQINLGVLGRTFFLPLLISPLVAVALGALLYLSLRWFRLRLGITKEWCLCVGQQERVMAIPQPASVAAFETTVPVLTGCVAEQGRCDQRYTGRFWGIGCQQLMDTAHFLSAGVVSFARGLNDTPKIAALLLVIPQLDVGWSLVAVAIAIAVGGLLNARQVAETMSHKITAMNHGQGFSANVATGVLVTSASLFGLPVSTTHVSVGCLFGIGAITRQADLGVIRNILLSWLVTLPCAAILGVIVYWLIKL